MFDVSKLKDGAFTFTPKSGHLCPSAAEVNEAIRAYVSVPHSRKSD